MDPASGLPLLEVHQHRPAQLHDTGRGHERRHLLRAHLPAPFRLRSRTGPGPAVGRRRPRDGLPRARHGDELPLQLLRGPVPGELRRRGTPRCPQPEHRTGRLHPGLPGGGTVTGHEGPPHRRLRVLPELLAGGLQLPVPAHHQGLELPDEPRRLLVPAPVPADLRDRPTVGRRASGHGRRLAHRCGHRPDLHPG